MRRSVQYAQNFLRNERLVERLVRMSSIGAGDLVLDIGAGSGSLTRALAARAGRVTAYEADGRLARNLQAAFASKPHIRIIQTNFLQVQLPQSPYKVFANIPFNRTSDIMRTLLASALLQDAYLIMQREAALKYMGEPGKMSLTAIRYAPYFEMNLLHTFRADDFVPRPAVTVVLLHCQRREAPQVELPHQALYADLISYTFNHANPNILPALHKLFPGRTFATLEPAFSSKLTAKPSQLTIDDWLLLFDLFQTTASSREQRLVTGTAQRLTHEAAGIEKHHRTRLTPNWRSPSTQQQAGGATQSRPRTPR